MDLTLIKLKDIKFSPFDKPKNSIPYDSKKYDWVRLSNSIMYYVVFLVYYEVC